MRCRLFLTAIAFCIATAPLLAQDNYYEERWKKIDSLLNKEGLTKSALELLDEIYATAKKERNSVNAIRSLMMSSSLRQTVEYDVSAAYVAQIETAAGEMPAPANSILLSMAAQQYELLYQRYRYQIDGRSATVNYQKNDIATWSANDFYEKIRSLYLQSIRDTITLQKAAVDDYEALFIGSLLRNLRPTLFDVLAHRVIDFFDDNNPFNISRSLDVETWNKLGFTSAEEFTAARVNTKDNLSPTLITVQLLQQLTKMHAADKDPSAYIDIDLLRLQMVYENSGVANKDSLYESAVQLLAEKYDGRPGADRAWLALANLYSARAATFNALHNPVNQYENVKAVKILQKLAAQKDSTITMRLAVKLLQEIEDPELSFDAEKVNEAGKPFRMLAKFRNVATFKVRIVKVTAATADNFEQEHWSGEGWEDLLNLPVYRAYTQKLPVTADYQKHAVEIKLSALPPGEYALLACYGERFFKWSDSMSVQFFRVSNLACINNKKDVFVVDRENGRPVAGASVRMWKRGWSGNSIVYYPGPLPAVTDSNGYCRMPDYYTSTWGIALQVVTPIDNLFVTGRDGLRVGYDGDHIPKARAEYEEYFRNTHFFTDRSIYRPGQAVYFKAVCMTTDFKTKRSKLVTGKKLKIFFKDANDEVVDSMIISTNQFGSVTGKFKIPVNRLTGSFSVYEEKGQADFSVEEYKRPRFAVTCNPVAGSYRLGDSITVTGLAKSFAGNSIDGAAVKYTITRRAGFSGTDLYWERFYSPEQAQEIMHGETVTLADGTFSITFKAIPDQKIKQDLDPVFTYEIIADVTDLNGETRTAETYVKASYKALNLEVDLRGEHRLAEDFSSINISTTNMAGQFQQSLVTVSMHRLATPARMIRERYWQQPDLHLFSKATYLKYFPYDEYSNESSKESWERLDKVLERSDSTVESGNFSLNTNNFSPGWYVVEVTTHDKYGEPIKATKYIELRSNDDAPVNPQYDWKLVSSAGLLPGDTATIATGSSADVYIIQCIDRGENKFQYNFTRLNNAKKITRIPVRERDRGGIAFMQAFVKHNRIYTANAGIDVDWEKDLQVAIETFRDKTLPGSEEKWKVKISGRKKEKLLAEMLTAMYDASLDQFTEHSWTPPNAWPHKSLTSAWNGDDEFKGSASIEPWQYRRREGLDVYAEYDKLFAGFSTIRNADGSFRSMIGYFDLNQLVGRPRTLQVPDWTSDPNGTKGLVKDSVIVNEAAVPFVRISPDGKPREQRIEKNNVAVRTNFNETAFFFPQLHTDSSGNIEFNFTMPESVTRWKWMMLAHTKELSFGYIDTSVITQKELMVQPNLPRFVREGDSMAIVSKVVNTGAHEMSGEMQLQLLDAVTNEPVSELFANEKRSRSFIVPAGQSKAIPFSIKIPYNFTHPVSIQFIAKSGNMSDGEEHAIPVLSNRMLVTESMPLNMRGSGTKNFTFSKLLGSDSSKTLSHHSVTLEFTGNPAWNAVQSLPYLMEYPFECAEQTWNRLYANALAASIVQKSPRIQQAFSKWQADSTVLISKLQKNEELKSVLLQETPWVLDAQMETEQQKRIALLFDMAKMGGQLHKTVEQLRQMQMYSGAFPWFTGGDESEYITQYIVCGIGHLKKLGGWPAAEQHALTTIATNALHYLDAKIEQDYYHLLGSNADTSKEMFGYLQVQYLYMRSFFPEIKLEDPVATKFYQRQVEKFWLKQNRYMQGMIALALYRSGDKQTAQHILRSLKENSIMDEERGMFWKGMEGGYYWYQAPVETQSLMIEAFTDITNDTVATDALKLWLLKNKQTNNWSTTKATAEACYALLLQGSDWLNQEPVIEIKLGDKTVLSREQKTSAGSGYFKKAIEGKIVNSSMGNITVNVTNAAQPSWGAVYWQYFEHLDKITPAATPLSLTKKLFVQRGTVLKPVQGKLTVGDKVMVRIELRVDRDMEFVHLKDMRAAALEPVNVLSTYKWQDGLGYYESTKDASTNFFFTYLPRGTYVFEYPLFVTSKGTFSNGITSIQCMYAPEFSSHSEGVKINVE